MKKNLLVLLFVIIAVINVSAQDGDDRYGGGDNTSTTNSGYSEQLAFVNDGPNLNITYKGVCFKMILVEAGPFDMGFTPDQDCSFTHGERDEGRKPHRVNITRNYYIGETEVTQELWNAVMGIEPSQNPALQKGDRYPVSNISWNMAIRFVNRLNDICIQQNIKYRFNLPTEAQWEYAARGGHKISHTVFSGSNTLAKVGWYNNNSVNRLKEVKLLSPNELGIYDMTGNVWELCRDWKAPYSTKAVDDPTGPEEGDKAMNKVRRGGSYEESDVNIFRVSYRRRIPIDEVDYKNGMRLVMSIQ